VQYPAAADAGLSDGGPSGTARLSGDARERLAGVRAELGDEVAWGAVTQAQADLFYARLEARILRGL